MFVFELGMDAPVPVAPQACSCSCIPCPHARTGMFSWGRTRAARLQKKGPTTGRHGQIGALPCRMYHSYDQGPTRVAAFIFESRRHVTACEPQCNVFNQEGRASAAA